MPSTRLRVEGCAHASTSVAFRAVGTPARVESSSSSKLRDPKWAPRFPPLPVDDDDEDDDDGDDDDDDDEEEVEIISLLLS